MPQPRRILVIDDDPNLRRTLSLILERAGHEVTSIDRGRQALSRSGYEAYNLIIVDIIALEPGAVELLLGLQQCCAQVPILILIGQDLTGLDQELRRYGAGAILYKPFDSERLLTQVTHLLREKRPPKA
jgi:DNA-binding response OmpR family regulator